MNSGNKVDVTAFKTVPQQIVLGTFLVSSPLLPGFDGRNPAHPCPVGL